MTENEILAVVMSVLQKELPEHQSIGIDTHLGDVPELDSLAFEEVLMRFEDEFHIVLPVETITEEAMSTPKRIAHTLYLSSSRRES